MELKWALEESARALYDEVTETVTRWEDHEPSTEAKHQLLDTIDILIHHSPTLKLIHGLRIHGLLENLFTSGHDGEKKLAEAFLSQMTDDTRPLKLGRFDHSTTPEIVRMLINIEAMEYLNPIATKGKSILTTWRF